MIERLQDQPPVFRMSAFMGLSSRITVLPNCTLSCLLFHLPTITREDLPKPSLIMHKDSKNSFSGQQEELPRALPAFSPSAIPSSTFHPWKLPVVPRKHQSPKLHFHYSKVSPTYSSLSKHQRVNMTYNRQSTLGKRY